MLFFLDSLLDPDNSLINQKYHTHTRQSINQSLFQGKHHLVEISTSIKGADHRHPYICKRYLRDIQFVQTFKIVRCIDQIFPLGLQYRQMLFRPVHVLLLIESYMTQLILPHQPLSYRLLHHVVDQVIEAVHLDVKHLCEVGVGLDGEDADPPKSYPHLFQLHGLQDLAPLGQVLLGLQPEHHYRCMQGLQRHQCVQVVLFDGCFDEVLVGLSAGIGQRDLNEVSHSLFPQRWSLFCGDLRQYLQFLLDILLLVWCFLGLFGLESEIFAGFGGESVEILCGVVLEVALQVVGVDVFLLVELVDVVGVEVDVLHAFEVEFGEEVLFEAFEVVVGDHEGLAVDLLDA